MASHLATASLPSTANYVLTATGPAGLGKGVWSNPATNPLIVGIVPQYTTTQYTHLISDNNTTVTITLRTDGFITTCFVTESIGAVVATTPRMWLGNLPDGYGPPILGFGTNNWFGSAELENNATPVSGQFSIDPNSSDGLFIELEGNDDEFQIGEVCGLYSQTWQWPNALGYPTSPSISDEKKLDVVNHIALAAQPSSKDELFPYLEELNRLRNLEINTPQSTKSTDSCSSVTKKIDLSFSDAINKMEQ